MISSSSQAPYRFNTEYSPPELNTALKANFDWLSKQLTAQSLAVAVGRIEAGTKGDLIVSDGVTRQSLAAPSENGYALVYDSATSVGEKWGLQKSPTANMYRNAAATHTSNGGYQKLSLDATDFDVYYGGTTQADTTNGRVVIRRAGKYGVNAHVALSANTIGTRGVGIALNGVLVRVSQQLAPATVAYLSVTSLLDLAIGDVLELQAYQNSGGNLAYNNEGTALAPRLEVCWESA